MELCQRKWPCRPAPPFRRSAPTECPLRGVETADGAFRGWKWGAPETLEQVLRADVDGIFIISLTVGSRRLTVLTAAILDAAVVPGTLLRQRIRERRESPQSRALL